MDKLLAGYRHFRENAWPDQQRLFESLAQHGQNPRAMVVACVDSRVDPAMIFNAAPGELLTVRNVANLVPPYEPDAAYHGTSAALEFGVRVLEVSQIVVLGHGLCGGVRALLEGAPQKGLDFIERWMSMADRARECAMHCTEAAARQQRCEQELIRISLANLLTFPWIRERVDGGKLVLHGAWFDVGTGVLEILRHDGVFVQPQA